MASTLCNRCLSGLLDKEIDIPVRFNSVGHHIWDHYQTFNELKTSALECACCSQLVKLGPSDMLGDKKSHTRDFHFVVENKTASRCSFRFTDDTTSKEISLWLLICHERSHPYSLEQTDLTEEPIWTSDTPASIDERLHLIQKLYHICLEKHESCSQRQADITLPTRLIEIPSDETMPPRLVETQGLQSIQYTTLSHRWGDEKHQPLRTLLDNIEEYKQAIRLSSIPKTFLDAISITRKFGVKYIWIDALCIIQDSVLDWQQQAGRMCDVYSGTFLNIAALDSIDAFGGCFPQDLPPPIKFYKPDCLKESIRIRVSNKSWDGLSDGIILTRGWVFQEVELSPRILYCGKNKFFWRCSTCICSEDGNPAGFRIPFQLWHGTKDPRSKWWSMMLYYSQLSFTYEKDRLPALTGITMAFQKKYGLTHLLGCWKEHLIEGLNWSLFMPVTRKRQDLPSWSWLSFGCSISMYMNFFVAGSTINTVVPCLSILHASTEWEGQELISPLKSSKLIIRGLIFQVDWPGPNSNLDTSVRPEWPKGFRFSLDSHGVPKPSAKSVWRTCLFLCLDRTPEPCIRLYFLVLEQAESDDSSKVPKYYRIGHGVWEFRDSNFKGPHLQCLAKALDVDISDFEHNHPPQEVLERILRRKLADIELI